MKNYIRLGLFIVGMIFTTTSSLQASPAFAKQYDMQCASCHVSLPPMLNSTGMKFLRNGFRFSKSDETAYSRMMSDDEDKQYYPVAGFLSAVYSSELDKLYPQAIIFLTGSITQDVSLFAGMRLGIIDKNPEDTDSKQLDDKKKSTSLMMMGAKIYAQYNLDDKGEQVVRAGIVTPTTPFGNVRKATEHALSSNMQAYKTPLSVASTKPLVGAEYSYLLDDKTLFYVAAGMLPGKTPGKEIAAGIGYKTDFGLKYGVIYQKIMGYDDNLTATIPTSGIWDPELRLANRDTVILPIEKDFGICNYNVSFVYKTDDYYVDDFYGVENGLTFPLFGTDAFRLIANIDNEQRKAYSGTYSMFINSMYIISLSAERVDTDIYKENIFDFTASWVF